MHSFMPKSCLGVVAWPAADGRSGRTDEISLLWSKCLVARDAHILQAQCTCKKTHCVKHQLWELWYLHKFVCLFMFQHFVDSILFWFFGNPVQSMRGVGSQVQTLSAVEWLIEAPVTWLRTWVTDGTKGIYKSGAPVTLLAWNDKNWVSYTHKIQCINFCWSFNAMRLI